MINQSQPSFTQHPSADPTKALVSKARSPAIGSKTPFHAPDAAIWRGAENKELDMLFGRSTFEMTDRPDESCK